MDPDDNFSPPLDGLSRGKKLHQLLTTLSKADIVSESKYLKQEEADGRVVGVISVDDVISSDDETGYVGALFCNWWHMRYEPDWWEFKYVEMDPNGETETVESSDGEEKGILIDTLYSCGWHRQENEHVPGSTYLREWAGEEWQYEPFEPDVEAPKPLARAIIDTHLPRNIQSRY